MLVAMVSGTSNKAVFKPLRASACRVASGISFAPNTRSGASAITSSALS
jgi:hypothetical protein